MNHVVLAEILSIYASVALPALAYVIRLERRLTRIETKIDSYICPLVHQTINQGENYD